MEDIISRIKKILAKAESTEFESEAEVFYAKAAELIARHNVSEDQLKEVQRSTIDDVEIRRVVVKNPYSIDRMQILHTVARILGGDSYYMRQARDGTKTRYNIRDHNTYCYVIGFPDDIDRIVQMYESLSRQCERYRNAESANRYFSGMGPKKVWNANFIRGYFARIGRRLREVMEFVYQEQSSGVALVLRSKREMIQEKKETITLESHKSNRQYSSDGWAAGMSAADRTEIRKEVQS